MNWGGRIRVGIKKKCDVENEERKSGSVTTR